MPSWFRWRKRAAGDGDEPPIPLDDLKALFEWLGRPNPPPCDHTHRETIDFLQARSLPVEPTVAWLQSNGGYCDCEVIFNVAEKWGDCAGWQPIDEDE